MKLNLSNKGDGGNNGVGIKQHWENFDLFRFDAGDEKVGLLGEEDWWIVAGEKGGMVKLEGLNRALAGKLAFGISPCVVLPFGQAPGVGVGCHDLWAGFWPHDLMKLI